jgi:hypothetical protein
VSLAPADLRARVQSQILADLGQVSSSPRWRVATLAYDVFPGADLSDREALSFAVGLVSTTFLDGRQPSGGVAPARTTIGVRFSCFLRSDAHVADYDVALAREAELVASIRSAVGAGGPAARLVSIDREVVGDGTLYLAEVRAEVFHPYPL